MRKKIYYNDPKSIDDIGEQRSQAGILHESMMNLWLSKKLNNDQRQLARLWMVDKYSVRAIARLWKKDRRTIRHKCEILLKSYKKFFGVKEE
jgi:hypothetical protein